MYNILFDFFSAVGFRAALSFAATPSSCRRRRSTAPRAHYDQYQFVTACFTSSWNLFVKYVCVCVCVFVRVSCSLPVCQFNVSNSNSVVVSRRPANIIQYRSVRHRRSPLTDSSTCQILSLVFGFNSFF